MGYSTKGNSIVMGSSTKGNLMVLGILQAECGVNNNITTLKPLFFLSRLVLCDIMLYLWLNG